MLSNYALFFIENPSNELIDILWPEYTRFSEMDKPTEAYGTNHIYLCPIQRSESNKEWFMEKKKRDRWVYSRLIEVTEEEIDKFIAMHHINNMDFIDFMKLNR